MVVFILFLLSGTLYYSTSMSTFVEICLKGLIFFKNSIPPFTYFNKIIKKKPIYNQLLILTNILVPISYLPPKIGRGCLVSRSAQFGQKSTGFCPQSIAHVKIDSRFENYAGWPTTTDHAHGSPHRHSETRCSCHRPKRQH